MLYFYIFISLVLVFILFHLIYFIIFKINYRPVLMYHRVTNVKKDKEKRYIEHKGGTLDLDTMKVSYNNFKRQMDYLKRNNYITTSFYDTSKKGKKVIITFDDGYKDNYLNAYHILKNNNQTATIYVTVDKVINNEFMPIDENDQVSENRLLTVENMVFLSENGFEIGSHTLSHPYLNELSYLEQEKELSESKEKLEKILNKKIVSFAYPSGMYNKDSLEIVRKYYDYAVVTARGTDLKLLNKSKYEIEREAISSTDSMFMFKLKVIGVHRFLRKLRWVKFIRRVIK